MYTLFSPEPFSEHVSFAECCHRVGEETGAVLSRSLESWRRLVGALGTTVCALTALEVQRVL